MEKMWVDLIKLFFPEYQVIFWDRLSIDKENKQIIIPKGLFLNLEEDMLLWLIIFLFEKKEYTKEIDNDNLDSVEKRELLKLFNYLRAYWETKSSILFDKKEKIKKFFEYLSRNITYQWPLWEFIKQKLMEVEPVSDIETLIDEYLEFKWAYLQSQCEECSLSDWDEGELLEQQDSYYEHSWENFESIEWEDNGVIWVLEPAIRKTYFVEAILEKFDTASQKFYRVKAEKKPLSPFLYEQIYSNYKIAGKKLKEYVLPLSKDLKLVRYNSDEVTVYQDEYGVYYIRFLKNWETEVWIWYATEQNNFWTAESKNAIYSGYNINLDQFGDWKQLLRYIKSKKYGNVSQRQFHGPDVNKYIENLFEAQEMDCLPANILFTALVRSLWYPSRLVVWYQTYIKDGKTYVSKSQWHAWSEILVNWQWIRVDATPVNTDEKDNDDGDMDNMIEQIIEDNMIEPEGQEEVKDFEIKLPKKEIANVLDQIPNIESKYFRSALEYVRGDAEAIIKYIKKLLDTRQWSSDRQELRWVPKRKKQWQPFWKLKVTPNSISRLAVWDPNIFERPIKMKNEPNEDIDTRLEDISIAIDVSGSMESLTGNWRNWTKLDNAYLSVVLLYVVSKALNINFERVVLFSDDIVEGNPEEILKQFENVSQRWNKANTVGIEKAIEAIKDTQKWVVFVISDGDSATRTAFFSEESKEILRQNENLYVVWYGIGEDAVSKLIDKMKRWKVPTVIEYRMQEADNKRSRWFNVENYYNLVGQVKGHLEQFMTASFIRL